MSHMKIHFIFHYHYAHQMSIIWQVCNIILSYNKYKMNSKKTETASTLPNSQADIENTIKSLSLQIN